MKKLAAALLVALACVESAHAAVAALVMDTPTTETYKTHKGASKSSARRNKRMTDILTTQTFYTGRVRCMLGKDETADYTVEAIFVVHGVGDDKTPDTIVESKTVASLSFAPGGPNVQSFTAESPKTSITRRTDQYRGSVEKDTNGKVLTGAVFRLVGSQGVLQVKTVPRNSAWETLAKKPVFELPKKRRH